MFVVKKIKLKYFTFFKNVIKISKQFIFQPLPSDVFKKSAGELDLEYQESFLLTPTHSQGSTPLQLLELRKRKEHEEREKPGTGTPDTGKTATSRTGTP